MYVLAVGCIFTCRRLYIYLPKAAISCRRLQFLAEGCKRSLLAILTILTSVLTILTILTTTCDITDSHIGVAGHRLAKIISNSNALLHNLSRTGEDRISHIPCRLQEVAQRGIHTTKKTELATFGGFHRLTRCTTGHSTPGEEYRGDPSSHILLSE